MSDSDTVISVENLGKRYMIGHESHPGGYQSFRETMSHRAKNVIRKAGAFFRGDQIITGDEVEQFWAIKNVSFEVKRGEVLGIIGRNGAGKSTLLKILSRITEPTEGRIKIRGRVASLLEVGTGFHPELTGRENIFLNGAILGMSKQEILKKFEEIVKFAEVETFLDTPVKRYSSGMYTRLAFAVAAHLEPEILIVDEVLAVGDSDFQKKCLGKMHDVSRKGKTVLLVSHNLQMISNLCNKCILLDRGGLEKNALPREVIRHYLAKGVADSSKFLVTSNKLRRKASPYFELDELRLTTEDGNSTQIVRSRKGSKITLSISGDVLKVDARFNLGICVNDDEGRCVFLSFSTDAPDNEWPRFKIGQNNICVSFDVSYLNMGKYYVYLLASLHCVEMLLTTEDDLCVSFEIVGTEEGSSYWTTRRQGILAPQLVWRVATQ